jgi:gamma-glutamyltranspeptidase
MGYTIQTIPPFGAAETIAKSNGEWIGVNDPRSRDGSVAGE